MRSLLCALLIFLLGSSVAFGGEKTSDKSFMVGPLKVGTLKGSKKDGFCVRVRLYEFSGDSWLMEKGSRLDLGARVKRGAGVALVFRF